MRDADRGCEQYPGNISMLACKREVEEPACRSNIRLKGREAEIEVNPPGVVNDDGNLVAYLSRTESSAQTMLQEIVIPLRKHQLTGRVVPRRRRSLERRAGAKPAIQYPNLCAPLSICGHATVMRAPVFKSTALPREAVDLIAVCSRVGPGA
jgi:hypothetical protein